LVQENFDGAIEDQLRADVGRQVKDVISVVDQLGDDRLS
jgi:hypothetical protein